MTGSPTSSRVVRVVSRGSNSAVNVRMPTALLHRLDEAAQTAHLDRSGYCRELLTAAADSGLTLSELVSVIRTAQAPTPALLPAPDREPARRLGQRRKLTGKCLHPPHRILRYPTRDVCAACDTTIRTR